MVTLADRPVDEDWPLLLRTGYGNVFGSGRWTHDGVILLAIAINSDDQEDWDIVAEWAQMVEWDESDSN